MIEEGDRPMNRPKRPKRRTKIVATVGPASRSPEMLERADLGRRRRLPAQLLARDRRRARREHRADPRGQRARSASWSAILGDLPGPKLRLDEVENGVVRLSAGKRGDADDRGRCVGDESELPVGWEGFTRRRRRGRPDLPRRRPDPAARRLESSAADVLCEVETGGTVASHQGVNLPGVDRRHAGDRRRRHGLGRVRGRATASTCSRSRSCAPPPTSSPIHERLASRGSDIPLIAKIEKPQARRERRGDHRCGGERDHGRPRRPRDRAADRGGPGDAEAADPAGRQAVEAGDHRDPDARLDGHLATGRPGPR